MVKRMSTALVVVGLFFGLMIPQNALEILKPNVNAAEVKTAAKGQANKPGTKNKKKKKGKTKSGKNKKGAKTAAIKKIREGQRILDRAYGPGAGGINQTIKQLNIAIRRLK